MVNSASEQSANRLARAIPRLGSGCRWRDSVELLFVADLTCALI